MADAPPPDESSEDYAAARALEYKNRGNAKFKERDYEGAVQAFSEAIALDPSNAVLYSNRSGAYLAMRRTPPRLLKMPRRPYGWTRSGPKRWQDARRPSTPSLDLSRPRRPGARLSIRSG